MGTGQFFQYYKYCPSPFIKHFFLLCFAKIRHKYQGTGMGIVSTLELCLPEIQTTCVAYGVPDSITSPHRRVLSSAVRTRKPCPDRYQMFRQKITKNIVSEEESQCLFALLRWAVGGGGRRTELTQFIYAFND